MNALNVQSLTLSYDRAAVVTRANLQVETGRIVGVLGPNGAGKSTLIKGILGLHRPDGGQVSFFGEPLRAVRNRVVYVPQRSSVDWDFPVTVEDVVLMGRYGRLGLFGRLRRQDREITRRALEQIGIADLARRQISELSGGQQQRVFLARALAQDGDLIFMDEPFVGVDAATEEAIVLLLREMRDQGKTVIVVNHDLQTARSYFDELVLLNKQIIAHGPTEDVFTPELLARTYGGRLAVIDGEYGDKILIAA
jgi:manganese/zinc/iron transport system ATP- binding protein